MNIQTEHGVALPADREHGPKTITIIVEVDGKNKEIKFDHSPVTGAEIRSAAGVPANDDLTRLHGSKPTGGNIGPSDTVEIENGDHFLAAPTGVVS
jgi:hypothetical protein